MKFYTIILSVVMATSLFSQNTVCFTVEENPNTTDPALSVFSKYVNVYGCGIYAESSVSDVKVLHAAAVWAELIDNNEDGIVDDPALHNELINNGAIMPIFEADENTAMLSFMENYNGSGVSAVLWQSEIAPNQPGRWGHDATVEEILHTINAVGHVNVYPTAFDLSPNSSQMSAAMDAARGGQFLSVPPSYPGEAWYHYNDQTCGYECMVIEYMYWSIVSWMGILDDASTCSGILNEWEPCSPSLFQNTDLLMHNIITDPSYKLPQLAPDGNYCPDVTGINSLAVSTSFTIYPNPASEVVTFKRLVNTPALLTISNMLGQQIIQKNLKSKEYQISISKLAPGTYNITLDNSNLQFIKF